MGIYRLLAMLIAFALLAGPVAMNRAMAAAPPSSSHAQTAADGHCRQADDRKTDQSPTKSCCPAMCANAAVFADAPAGLMSFRPLALFPASAAFRRGIHGELSTPPPRPA